MIKTIIFPWNHKEGPGIGDLIRGSYGLYLICKGKYNFLIDISGHLISEFLVIKPNIYSTIIKNDRSKFYNCPSKEELEIIMSKSLVDKDICCISTNCNMWVYQDKMEEEFINIIKEILSPKEELKTLIEEAKLNLGSYSCIHMRLGDNYKLNKLKAFKYFKIFQRCYSGNDLFVSDNENFKKYIENKIPGIKMLKTPPTHLGQSQDKIGIRNTLIEYFLISNSTSIKTYSNYCWVSGFVMSISKVFGIPILDLKTNLLY